MENNWLVWMHWMMSIISLFGNGKKEQSHSKARFVNRNKVDVNKVPRMTNFYLVGAIYPWLVSINILFSHLVAFGLLVQKKTYIAFGVNRANLVLLWQWCLIQMTARLLSHVGRNIFISGGFTTQDWRERMAILRYVGQYVCIVLLAQCSWNLLLKTFLLLLLFSIKKLSLFLSLIFFCFYCNLHFALVKL